MALSSHVCGCSTLRIIRYNCCISSIVAFHANVIQFGLDQLHDSQTDHLVLFIHWYVLLSYVGTELIKIPSSKVVSFAREHRNPVQRSAFTYCEDELPSRLDLEKESMEVHSLLSKLKMLKYSLVF